MPLDEVMLKKLDGELKPLFAQFDTDKGGSIDVNELGSMIESLGITLPEEKVKQMVDEADQPDAETGVKNGEIEYNEFFDVVVGEMEKPSGGIFASVIRRLKETGPAVGWNVDPEYKNGPGVSIDPDNPKICKFDSATDEWGAMLTDQWFSTGSDGYDKARVVVEVLEMAGKLRVGLAQKNYRKTPMNDDIASNAKCSVLNADTGQFTLKGDPKPNGQIYKPCPSAPFIKVGDRIQFAVDIRNSQTVKCEVLRKTNGVYKSLTNKSDQDIEDQGGGLESVGPEVAIIVGFGKISEEDKAAGKATRIKLVGSSSFKTSKDSAGSAKSDLVSAPATEKVDPLIAAAQSSGA
jgi:hypothetical protein